MKNAHKNGAMQAVQSTAKLPKTTVKNCLMNNTIEKHILSTTEPYRTILQLIGTGEENAIHLCELIKYTKLHNRELRKCIEQLRRSGEVIISGNNGYYKPETKEELKRYIRQETHRAKSIFFTLKSAIIYHKRLGG